MRAVWTLLLDSYRLLRARVLFWIALAISLLVGLIYLRSEERRVGKD